MLFMPALSIWVCNRERVCLQTALLNEALPNRRYVRLGIAQRGGRRVDRGGGRDFKKNVRYGRAENEFGIGPGLELYRFARRLQSRQVAVPQLVRNQYGARCDGRP